MAEAVFHFPDDMRWGTATSSHQVEGGSSGNQWWAWEQQPGRIYDDQRSGEACQWWSGRAEEDIERMAALHTNAHRLSLEWSRIEPQQGRWDDAAIDRYRAILKAMHQAGIEPMITLHHFTHPLWMEEQGGWLNPDSQRWFQRYTKKVLQSFADLCDLWCTINEPNVYAGHGYFVGSWPPGHKRPRHYFQVLYNLLEAHAAAYEQIHDIQVHARVGLAKHMIDWHPRSPASPLDRLVTNFLDRTFNAVTLDALATGEWRPPLGSRAAFDKVKGTLDWIGLNYYQRYDASFSLLALRQLGINYQPRPDAPKGPPGWGEIYPAGLLSLLSRLNRRFALPIYVTENGLPDEFDNHRPAFILEHVRQVWKAIMFNWPVAGYYFWSLLDNFEWAEGYDTRFRFGLYAVDFETQERKLRRSGELYAEIARTNTISSDMTRRFAPAVLDTLFPGAGPTHP